MKGGVGAEERQNRDEAIVGLLQGGRAIETVVDAGYCGTPHQDYYAELDQVSRALWVVRALRVVSTGREGGGR